MNSAQESLPLLIWNVPVIELSPIVFRTGEFRFFFSWRKEGRMHLHASHQDDEAKFWLAPTTDDSGQPTQTTLKLAATASIMNSLTPIAAPTSIQISIHNNSKRRLRAKTRPTASRSAGG